MPITQATMVELMHESRAAIQSEQELRTAIAQYLQSARTRYSQNQDLQEVAAAALAIIQMHPQPSDKATYRNEWQYRKVGKNNDRQRERQAQKRRQAGVLTQAESMERLALLNAARRAGDLPAQTYDQWNAGGQTQEPLPSLRAKPSRHLILPRDDPDDKELEFDLPPTATLDIGGPKLLDENNLQSGVDIPAELPDDSNGNPAKESGT